MNYIHQSSNNYYVLEDYDDYNHDHLEMCEVALQLSDDNRQIHVLMSITF